MATHHHNILAASVAIAFATYVPNLLAASVSAPTAPATTLKQAVQKAIATHPETQAAWHTFQAATNEERVVQGRYLPKLDVNGGIGNHRNETRGVGTSDYDRENIGFSFTQMIFDGFATSSEVARLDYTRLARYYDLMQASSKIALEAVTSYENVMKFRELVQLASENYIQHKSLYDAISQRVQAGVGRKVDLELATGRLALAESNLLTEATNLHDISAKYLHIVGELPVEDLDSEGMVTSGIPENIQDALKKAYEGNPEFNSAIEMVLASTSELEGRNAPFMPKLDLRAKQDQGKNVNGIVDRENDRVIELVATYNLYNGGSDLAAKDQFRERLGFAREQRDKICRNIRQDLSVAYNDILRLNEQLRYLNQHQLSISKAREAYRSQFDIGQRTLLDLLDTENEYFQAKRAYVSGQHDLAIAHARTLHSTGGLLTELKVQREKLPTIQELNQDRDLSKNQDLACPLEASGPVAIDKDALIAAATKNAYTPKVALPQAVPEAIAPQFGDIKTVCSDVDGLVRQWMKAWTTQDFGNYINKYSPTFTQPGMTRDQWFDLRQKRVTYPQEGIQLSVSNIRVQQSGNVMRATFDQIYDNKTYTDVVEKNLTFDNVGGKCLITEESVNKGRLY